MPNAAGWSFLSNTSIPFGVPPPLNRLLATLARHEFAALRPLLTPVPLAAGQLLLSPGEAIEHVVFPERGVLTVTADTGADDAGIEVAMIGPDGMAGTASLLGPHVTAFHQIRVQVPGTALRMPAEAFRRHLETVPAFRGQCLTYAEAFFAQASQTGACGGRHRVAERCAAWLLRMHDRTDGPDFPLTHEAIAAALGVRRAGVTVAMGELQDAGLVRSGKGRTTVLDQAGLEDAACGCYRLVRDRCDALFRCN